MCISILPIVLLAFLSSESPQAVDAGASSSSGRVEYTALKNAKAVNPGSQPLNTLVWVNDDFNGSTPGWQVCRFDSIQNGIDAVKAHGNVYVLDGIYHENILIDKPLVLTGEHRKKTVIDGGGNGHVVRISVDGVKVHRFTVQNSGTNLLPDRDSGICIESSNNKIINNIVRDNLIGVSIAESADGNIIDANALLNNTKYGVCLLKTTANNITGNAIEGSQYGIRLEYSKPGINSTNNVISMNTLTKNSYGIYQYKMCHNLFQDNVIAGNAYGFHQTEFSQYNVLERNMITGNSKHGLTSDWVSHYNTYFDNTISDNGFCGISLWHSSDNSLVMNTIENNMGYGISIVGCYSNAISLNMITDNKKGGIYLGGSNNTLISSNIITGNHVYGIQFESQMAELGSPHDNVITGNIISNHDYGVYIRSSYDNLVCMNYIMSHDLGISFKDGASDNTIYHNNLIGNLQHAYDECVNVWDFGKPVGGNYWDNYAGVDLNGDGLGDTVYKIPGGGNEDRYPLMNYAKIE